MSRIPLYNELQDYATDKYQTGYNTGLWYNKFCNVWARDRWELKSDRNNESSKKDWIDKITNRKIGDRKTITDYVQRLLTLGQRLQGDAVFYKTEWRFVTGLGLEHPIENGFAWHFTLGMPYLPGCSVKGLVRAWATSDFNQAKDCTVPDDIVRVFGNHQDAQRGIGSVIFFDALPTAPVKLEADVMTPHYSPYYQKEQVPGDWHKPEPIPFLTVATGETFVFTVAPRNPGDKQNQEDVKLALKWLEQALECLGAGAKTATGYGRFVRDDANEQKWQAEIKQKLLAEHRESERQAEQQKRERMLAKMSVIRREMEQDGYSSEEFMSILTSKWLERMEHADTSLVDKQEIASLLADWYQQYKQKDWHKPNKKNKVKIQRIKAVLAEFGKESVKEL